MTVEFDLNSKKNNFRKYTHVKSILLIDTCLDFKPHVSIMVPTFKRPHLLKETLDSAIGQKTDVHFEVVIVDNDADAEFAEELEKLVSNYNNANIRYYRNEENIGMFGNWNRCIELARGSYISILNDDDILSIYWLKNVVNLVVHGLVKVETETFSVLADLLNSYGEVNTNRKSNIKIGDLFWGNINPGSLGLLMVKSECLILGGFDESLYPTADYDFICRYIKEFGGIQVHSKLASYRWLENESLRVETLEKFIEHDYIMRQSFFTSKINIINDIIMFLIELALIRSCFGYEKVNNRLNVDKILTGRQFSAISIYIGKQYQNRYLNFIIKKMARMIF